jgi:hypothetical protein
MDVFAQAEREKQNLFYVYLYILFGLSKDWIILAHIGEGHLLY